MQAPGLHSISSRGQMPGEGLASARAVHPDTRCVVRAEIYFLMAVRISRVSSSINQRRSWRMSFARAMPTGLRTPLG